MTSLNISTKTALALGIALVLAACASTPATNAAVESARSAYRAASADPIIVRSAPVELQQAQQALQKAEAAARNGDDAADIEHFAYVSRQRTEVAVQAGQIAQAEQVVAQSQAQRDRILIDARTRDAESQRDAAIKARTSAELSRTQAEAARKLAEERLAAEQAAKQQAAVASTRASSLEAQLAALKAKPTPRGMVLTLGEVLFDTGRASLKPGAMRTVDQLAAFLDKNPGRKVLIEGHTDSVGDDAFNRALSLERAQAVQQALSDRRVEAGRVEAAGLGEAYPVANNNTNAGRQQNRRVEVIFSDDAGSIRPRSN